MLLLSLLACPPPEKESSVPEEVCDVAKEQADAPALVPGVPLAGVAEDFLDLPVGVPLSGYTSRCIGQEGKVDYRDSAYAYAFTKSAGVETRIPVKVFWLTNGDQDLVIVKTDVIYSFDMLVVDIAKQLSQQTGRDLTGKVVVATNHSHGSYGDFSDQVTYYLGSDRFNYEIYSRVLQKSVDTSMVAFNSLQPAKIGVGFAKDWDPDDKVYRDRRDHNDDLQFFPDIPAGRYKDPTLTLIRVDTMDDQPLGLLYDFGVHGTTLGGDSAMISGDTPGHIERVLQERFDTPVVVSHLQGAAGDASPSTDGQGYGVMERAGEFASDAILELWSSTPTAADPIRLETVSRAVPETHSDIRVTRNGTVDLYYTPYQEGLQADNEVYASDGSILSPIDEFNVSYGAAFCGEDPPYLPGFAPSQAFPYNACVNVSQMINVINGLFDLDEEERQLPLIESTRALVTATRIGPLAMREADGTITSDDLFIGFFPGEITSMYTEQFRRRAQSELGYAHTMAVGYAQDHEGYLLIPEDWLQGGYEADINIWGPLQGEHIMEQLLVMAGEELSTDVIEKPDPCGLYQVPDYGVNVLPTLAPEVTPEAGTYVEGNPGYIYSPLYNQDELNLGGPPLEWSSEVPRVQGLVEFVWIGGDPGIDFPLVTLQKQEGDAWVSVENPSGRTITSGPDILTTYTPDPLAPVEAAQTHYWYAAWQAIGPKHNRLGLPAGTYRLHVEGSIASGASTTWPWGGSLYSVDSRPFEIVPARIDLTVSGTDLIAAIPTATRGYRLLSMDMVGSSSRLEGQQATISIEQPDGRVSQQELVGTAGASGTVFAGLIDGTVLSVTVTDIHGNIGTWTAAR